ncbi:nucleotidyl transferase AbiEii/AbiGii toxin family protein [Phyllobacterium chamaecytisi]|uniref:nucleotidyl transferase AbiEii/AbiGii toxin family protein n=1 Tax=Phyllobacterium chamaecytisi TaxID=2876082 RepID=UPI001CCCB3A5|nr:nucleotidyl transferase AbiEii/AbiGii toxin family protein [Phyllobacterium sp. KW56]MBZ9605819.1 nucleotidyl transferase AbiEii/AbiGii toxin family protein [Phyllobacterium sp. KW56]
MTRYAIERVLYRLSVSPYRDHFVLKGAMLFSLWAPVPYRATGDLDLLGFGENAPVAIAAVFAEILATKVEDEGVIFRPDTLRAAPAREQDEYAGVRLDFVAELAGARLAMLVDIGYGDAITPGPVDMEYPSLLGQPAPHLKAYPPETVVAEKFQAMVALDMLNSRMKDFFDLWAIAGAFAFEGEVLARAPDDLRAPRDAASHRNATGADGGLRRRQASPMGGVSEANRDRPRAAAPSGNSGAHRRTCDATHDRSG